MPRRSTPPRRAPTENAMGQQGSHRRIPPMAGGAGHTVAVSNQGSRQPGGQPSGPPGGRAGGRAGGRPSGTAGRTTVSYGRGIAGDDELRLCGDVSGGRRALELGISDEHNAARLARLRGPRRSPSILTTCRVWRPCVSSRRNTRYTSSATLAISPISASPRVARSRWSSPTTRSPTSTISGGCCVRCTACSKPSHPFVIAMAHPFADVHADDTVRPYGTGARTVGEWFTALGRANFRVDVMHELGVSGRSPVPTTLVLRARKEGS